MYSGRSADALAEIAQIARKSRSVADERTALFARTSLDIYTGDMTHALASLDAQHAVAQKAGDTLGMVGDLQTKATVLTEMGKADEAAAVLEDAAKLTEQSNLPGPIKSNIGLAQHNGLARAALAKKDLAAARQHAEAFASGARASGNPNQVRQSHELAGMIALAASQWDTAIAELQQANLQNAYNRYRLCQAYAGKGDTARAKEECTAAAQFNPLPELNYSFIHAKAKKMAGTGS
jgi:hypothetical protein